MKIAIATIIPALLLALAAHRIRSNARNRLGESTGARNPVTQILICLGLAKLCRIPYITDDLINPVLREATGVANIMSLAGMTFGALAAVPALAFSAYITGRKLSTRTQSIASIVIIVAMIVTFLRTPMAHTPTSYMSNQFAVSGPVLAYWVAFLTPMAVCTLTSSVLTLREALWVRRGPFAWALGGISTTFVVGVIYCCFKVFNLVLQYRQSNSFFREHAPTISLFLTLAALVTSAGAAAVYAWHVLKDRVIRYRLLRRFGAAWMEARTASPDVVLDQTDEFRPTRRICWDASRSAETAYRLQIELADHKHQTTRGSHMTSQEAS